MASRKILVQLDIAAASNLTSPLSGFVGFSAKADGLYQKIGTSPELRLLTSADVQNAILADGSITGAVSQAQTFTLGIKLSNLTQGYIPYASGATKLLSNSPIYTDGTNVGIGTTDPGAYKLNVNGNTNITGNLNLSSLTASKVVFTNASKNLTSTGIGTASQFIKGDGSLDSNTYLTTGTTIITGSGVSGRITFWDGTNSLSSSSSFTWNNATKELLITGDLYVTNYLSVDNLYSPKAILDTVSSDTIKTYDIQISSFTTPGYVLTCDAYGNGTWQAPTGGGSYTLPTASASVLGGVKIGSGITISSGVISVSTNYQAPITTGTTAQYLRGDLSLATFPTIHTGSGFNGGVTFWNEANSLSAAGELTWNNTTKNLSVTGGVSANNVSSNSMSTNSLSTNGFRLIATTTAGYVLTTDANGNGTWQAPTGASYTLPTATASVLGGVKIGSGITISSGVISVSTNYEAPLTFSSGLTRTGNTISFAGSSSYVPYTGANDNVDVGSYVMYANNFVLNSDINLKCNIESIEIKNIDIDYKKYEFKSLVGDIRYGVIAQELLKVAPELVSSTPNNTFSVKYIDLLIHEIAYLKQEIKKLTGGN